jgi:hypothetical protein
MKQNPFYFEVKKRFLLRTISFGCLQLEHQPSKCLEEKKEETKREIENN